jgi:hypothetical protein
MPLEKAYLKEIYKAYNRWIVGAGGKKLELKQIETLAEEHFGNSRGKGEYHHIRVFLDEEDLEEFDTTTDNAYTVAVPSEQIANHILNSEKKIELVRGLIEDKRACSSEIDSLESQVSKLEGQLKRKDELIQKLLNKIALLFVSLPDGVRPPASSGAL